MADPKFKLDYKGVGEVLKSPDTAAAINALAAQIAARAGGDAEMDDYTTDRRAASVRVPADQQARDGLLTRAAAEVGLEVRLKASPR